jgi:hypothetical protein
MSIFRHPLAAGTVRRSRNLVVVLSMASAVTVAAQGPEPAAPGLRRGGVHVIDSVGQVVGPYDGGKVLLKIGDFLFDLVVDKEGFVDAGGAFYHTTTDCSGPPYVLASENDLFLGGVTSRTQLFFAERPLQTITYRSFEYYNPSFAAPVRCNQTHPTTATAGPPAVFELSTLGFVPPFHVEF